MPIESGWGLLPWQIASTWIANTLPAISGGRPMRAQAQLAILLAVVGNVISLSAACSADDAQSQDQEVTSPDSLPAFDPQACEICAPRWSARMGAVFLQRARPESTPYIVNFNTGAPVVDPSNFVFPFQGGADVGLIRHGEQADIDFRYFGVNEWSASQGTINGPVGTVLAIPGSGTGSPVPVLLSPTYKSSLNSAEINLRRNVSSRLTLLGGFRYISLHDDLFTRAVDPNTSLSTDARFRTTNSLYGMQVGADTILWQNGGRFRVEGVIKAGLFGNSAVSRLSEAVNGGSVLDVGGSRSRPAFVGDLNFTGVYQINDRWALRGGYQLLWLSGVAVASEQLQGINFSTAHFSTTTANGAFFHGAMVGVERSW